ncbi:MAG: methyltransferase domain-containing protein [Candidatus Kapabacteria bacterium]|nr:methyltransferase domain-containing protein [Candidatus Kapabacteria bacterium]
MESTLTQQEELKSHVAAFWNNQPCGTHVVKGREFSREMSDEIERHRYTVEPEIHAFAQFTRMHGKKVLEVGVGAGTDFIQWVRAGADANGIDLTNEGVDLVRRRLDVYGLKPESLQVADCENIPFPDNTFDCVYSWGVIHHTADTPKAMREIIRVCKPGGICKVMIYNRHSLLTFFFWVQHALLKGKPFRSFADVLWNHMESIGTKAYTRAEAASMLKGQPVTDIKIQPITTYYDRLQRFSKAHQFIARIAECITGTNRFGWFLTMEFRKK